MAWEERHKLVLKHVKNVQATSKMLQRREEKSTRLVANLFLISQVYGRELNLRVEGKKYIANWMQRKTHNKLRKLCSFAIGYKIFAINYFHFFFH